MGESFVTGTTGDVSGLMTTGFPVESVGSETTRDVTRTSATENMGESFLTETTGDDTGLITTENMGESFVTGTTGDFTGLMTTENMGQSFVTETTGEVTGRMTTDNTGKSSITETTGNVTGAATTDKLIIKDVDECNSNPCRNGATCHGQVNGYRCTCASGFNGTNCDTVDARQPGSTTGPTCVSSCASQTDGYYQSCLACSVYVTCANKHIHDNQPCPAGHVWDDVMKSCQTKSQTCTASRSVNECVSHPCMNGASCNDDVNTYSCACVAGYTGTNCDIDIDECASSPCENGGTCRDEVNAFSCTCVTGLYTKKTCHEAIIHNYYQYGPMQGDVSVSDTTGYTCDWAGKRCASDFIRIPNVQFFNGIYKRLKIYTNGYITFGLNFDSRYPDRLGENMLGFAKRRMANRQGFGMLAPLWTDNDAYYGNVYYHIYDLTKPGSKPADKIRVKHAISHTRHDVIESGGVSVTAVTWVMVITWSKMIPRMYYWKMNDSPNTFQLVIAYDASRYQTFVKFIYMDMGWDNEYVVRRSMLGYMSYKAGVPHSLQLAPSMKSTSFRMQNRIGNTGEYGVYMFSVASGNRGINYEQKCFEWFANEMNRIWEIKDFWWMTLVCPCDIRLAMMDGRWKFDWIQYFTTNKQKWCIYERNPWGQSTQECCYTHYGPLISTEDGRGGQTFFYHPRYFRQHQRYDVEPKQWCCSYTDNCDLFYTVRPMDHCWGYTPLAIGWFYGDPHIRTLDGFQYTFNGLGEYTLIETTHGNFTLQGRTAKARDANGTETDATVFSAFAATDTDSDTVHVEMTRSLDGIDVFVNNENVTHWFSAANISTENDCGNVTLTKKNVTQVEVAFKSGFILTISLSVGQLDITIGAADKFKNNTKGLMGVYNDDPTDDLLPPGENVVPLSNSSSEKSIFYEFGEEWRIQSIDSLFYYAPGEGYSTFARTEFKPLFLEDVLANMTAEQRQKADDLCKGNKECLFDFAVTGKEEAAAATLATNAKNEETATSLSNASPNITVDIVINVTIGKPVVLNVIKFDQDGDTVTVTLTSELPNDASFTDDVFTWTPRNMDPVNISFSATDGKGGVAAADIKVNMCNCSGHGECQFDKFADGYAMKESFRVVQCNCSNGWEGDHCFADLDGCQDNPCIAGTNCTDIPAADQVSSGTSYTCSACPKGTKENDGLCLPINECDPSTPVHDCEQICVDADVGFTCTCRKGYRLTNERNCTDIDECQEGTSGCVQECTNKNGSYACSCVGGYSLYTADNKTCIIDQNMASKCTNLNCSYNCKENASGSPVCFCQSGYRIDVDDDKLCSDIDECNDNTDGCDHNCLNFVGGFNCSCNVGYQLMNDKKGCKTCSSGTWGIDCLRDCNCRDSDTECNVTTGCTACPDGFTGGDCHVDVDECDDNPCDEHATCNNTIGTFKCVCHAGYTQYNTTVCEDLDECESDPCQNGGECINGEKSYTCNCEAGYTGTDCEIDIDECSSSPCVNKGTCNNLVNKFRCACQRGFTGRTCETEINVCESNPCKNDANCTQAQGLYTCNCVPGYSGPNCDLDIDDCENITCLNGGTCDDLVGNYTCLCARGYTGPDCATDINECISTPCMNEGTCEDLVNGFSCNCTDNYKGTVCNIGRLCTASPCEHGGNCSETNNTRWCNCLPRYSGVDCETEIDECASSPCRHGGSCTQTVNYLSCMCTAGYTGSVCDEDINECACNPCMNSGTCVDLIDGFVCNCTDGYNGTTCVTDINECASNPCMNSGTCIDLFNGFVCNCTAGYNGTTCDMIGDVALSSENQSIGTHEDTNTMASSTEVVSTTTSAVPMRCLNGGTMVVLDGVASCDCTMKYSGDACEQRSNRDCASNPCLYGAKCQDRTDRFVCTCDEGFAGDTCETATTKTVLRGIFRVPYLVYKSEYNDMNSEQYKQLAGDVETKLEVLYRNSSEVGSRLIAVTNINFRRGSVVVNFDVLLRGVFSLETLQAIIRNETSLIIGGQNVDLSSFVVAYAFVEGTELPWLAVVVGIVLGCVIIALLVALVVYIARMCKVNEHSGLPDSKDSFIYSPTATIRRMYWQTGMPTMPLVIPAVTQRYNQRRMTMVNSALVKVPPIDWKIVRNFAQNSNTFNRKPTGKDEWDCKPSP